MDKKSVDGERVVRLCNYTDVYYRDRIGNDIDFMVATAPAHQVRTFALQPGDVLITKDSESWDDIAVAAVVSEPVDAICGYHLALLRPQPGRVDGRFLFYSMKSMGTATHFKIRANGVTRYAIGTSAIGDAPVPMPPLPRQVRIADYLDTETARIDALVDRKQRFIDLLLEKRTALITHAVTKGLDPTVEMKDSGVEWLGRIPAHWPQVRLGYFARVLNGTTPSRNSPGYWSDGDVPWLSSGTVNKDRITEPSEFITREALAECSLSLIPTGSVVMGLIGQGRTRGTVSILDIPASINQNMAAIIPGKRLVGRYLQYQLMNMYGPIREYGRGGNQAALNCELVRDIRLLLPSVHEQEAIAAFLDAQSANVEAQARLTRRSITLLREYRTALISAAVTGQIAIPGAETAEDVA